MSVSLFHKCLECGKQVEDGQRGLQAHFDGANPLKVSGCCDAMTARAASHTIKELVGMKKLSAEFADQLRRARDTRKQVRASALREKRTLDESGSPFHVE